MAQLLKIKAKESSIWAKECILMIVCVIWLDMTTPPWWREKVMIYYYCIIILLLPACELIIEIAEDISTLYIHFLFVNFTNWETSNVHIFKHWKFVIEILVLISIEIFVDILCLYFNRRFNLPWRLHWRILYKYTIASWTYK